MFLLCVIEDLSVAAVCAVVVPAECVAIVSHVVVFVCKMKCTNPRPLRPWHYNLARDGDGLSPLIYVDCGKCIACRANKAREWTMRLEHEASFAQTTIFITLSYDDEHLPEHGVSKEDVQNFISDLRQVSGPGIRYFIGSEYGESETATHRPHYHGFIFNAPDWIWQSPCAGASRIEKRRGKSNSFSWVNTAYNDIWKRGYVTVGTFHPRRAGYLAHYYVDKASAPEGMSPNFSLMSKRPGIGYQYVMADSDKMLAGFPLLSHTGRRVALPRFYGTQLRHITGEAFVPDERTLEKVNSSKILRWDLQEMTEQINQKNMSWNSTKKQI